MQPPGATKESPIALSPVKYENAIILKVQRQGRADVYYRIDKNTPLRCLLLHYCGYVNLISDHVRFLYDGTKVKMESTARILKMEDEDTIDVMSEQLGGGCLACPFCIITFEELCFC
ncbi:hypothetical protein SLE2022_065900 [Rubroshorea leprosula]